MRSIVDAYDRFCEGRFPLPTADDVAGLERRLEVVFPASFRDYLLNFNGGWFMDPWVNPTVEGCPRDRLVHLDGIGGTPPIAELGGDHSTILFDDNSPPEIIVIGATTCGYLLLLVTDSKGDDYGNILLKTFTESFFLARDIRAFFALLEARTSE